MTKEAMQDGAEKATALPPKRGGVDMHPYNGVEGTPGKGKSSGLTRIHEFKWDSPRVQERGSS